MISFLSLILRIVLKLVLSLFAIAFAISLLLVALIVLAFSLLKFLFTGQKPASAMVFGRFQKFSTQSIWPASPPPSEFSRSSGEVVDVEVREIQDEKRLP